MKQTKRRFETLSFYDHTGIEAHLEKMARQGWMVESFSNFGWVYRRIEPKQLSFSVTYYPKASEFDPEPSPGQRTFHDFCAHTGWKLAATWAQMQVFYNAEEDPVPIETDPVMEVETLHRAAKKNYLISYFVLMLLALLNGGLFIAGCLGDPIYQLSRTTHLFTGGVLVMLLFMTATELIVYFTWRARAKKAAERGVFLDTLSTAKLQKVDQAITLTLFVYWVIDVIFTGDAMMHWIFVLVFAQIALLIFLVNTIKVQLKRRKVSRGVNRTITLAACFVLSFVLMGALIQGMLYAVNNGVFEQGEQTYEYRGNTRVLYQDDLPLTVEDMVDTVPEAYTRRWTVNQSLLLGHAEARQWERLDWEGERLKDLEYTVTLVKAPFLYDLCKRDLFDKLDETKDDRIPEGYKLVYLSQDPVPWGAEEVYGIYNQQYPDHAYHWYLLCYADRIIEIKFDWEPTAEHMALVAERLGSS